MVKTSLDLAVIIPFKDKAKMTLASVTSLLKYGPEVKQILLVSNNSSVEELDKIRQAIAEIKHCNLVEYNHPFNYQKMNNWAVEQIQAKFILFLNNDTELIPASRGLLEKMYAKAGQKDVGVTGCLLLYGDGSTIQHAGVFLLPGGMADHLYVGKKLSKALKNTGSADFPYSPVESRPMTAVTGAVNIVERAKFLEAGSYNEAFVIGGGDVDLCIRLNKAGLQTWYVAGGYIIHKESQSRSHKPIPYGDFYQSYLSYITAYDTKLGDPFLPKITQGMK